MYVCGPTVYGPAHIGNFLTFVRFDVLYRVLRRAGYAPYYVRNITDVDDKTIRGAQAEGVGLGAFTERWTQRFHADCARLNMLPPDVEPRATAHIAEQIAMVETLVANGHAYVGEDGSVYYRVRSFADYGKLSHFDPEALRSQALNSGGAANLADEYERDAVADFALWKARKPEDGAVYWDSPWGAGRPGWHLECSAMSLKYLGTDFDLHGGGEDLCFPHHENEIAQSEAVTGECFARHWVHMVHLLVEGKKMSKSLGNFFTLADLAERGWAPAVVRYAFLGGHYRQQTNFTEGGLEAARSALEKLGRGARQLLELAGRDAKWFTDLVAQGGGSRWGEFANSWRALCHDLNTPACLGGLHSGLKRALKVRDADAALGELEGMASLCYALGIQLDVAEPAPTAVEVPEAIAQLAALRWQAKQARDFAEADRLRAALADAGFQVVDRKDGYDIAPMAQQ